MHTWPSSTISSLKSLLYASPLQVPKHPTLTEHCQGPTPGQTTAPLFLLCSGSSPCQPRGVVGVFTLLLQDPILVKLTAPGMGT